MKSYRLCSFKDKLNPENRRILHKTDEGEKHSKQFGEHIVINKD